MASDDETILAWAERENRILVAEDKHTLPTHLSQHLQAGHQSPGVLMVRPGFSISQLLTYLELIAHAGNAADFQNVVTFIP